MVGLKFLRTVSGVALLTALAACGTPARHEQKTSVAAPGAAAAATQPQAARTVSVPGKPVPPRSLDEILNDVGADIDQQAKVKQVIDRAGADWFLWMLAHRQEASQYDVAARQAFEAGDRDKAHELFKEWVEKVKATLPRTTVAREQIEQALDPAQRAKLSTMQSEPASAVSRAVHASVREATAGWTFVEPNGQCATCHARAYHAATADARPKAR